MMDVLSSRTCSLTDSDVVLGWGGGTDDWDDDDNTTTSERNGI
jgi:hypothetical protein